MLFVCGSVKSHYFKDSYPKSSLEEAHLLFHFTSIPLHIHKDYVLSKSLEISFLKSNVIPEKGACSKKEQRLELQLNMDGNANILLSIFCCGSLGSKGRQHSKHLHKKMKLILLDRKKVPKFTGPQELGKGWSGRVLTRYYGIRLWVTGKPLSGI